MNNPLLRRLSSTPHWAAWRYVEARKLPITRDGAPARVNDPSTWGTLAEAREWARLHNGAGVMFALTRDLRLAVVDFDGCIADRRIAPEVLAFISTAQSYAEVSPSGSGLHVWLALERDWTPARCRLRGAEIYTEKRFITVTERPVSTIGGYPFLDSRAPFPIRTVPHGWLEEWLAPFGYQQAQQAQAEIAARGAVTTVDVDDAELIERVLRSRQGAKVRRLLAGDTSGYPSTSEADAALCAALAWWTRDPAQIERLWLRSALGQREKVQRRADYRERTIARALQVVTPARPSDRAARWAAVADALEGWWS